MKILNLLPTIALFSLFIPVAHSDPLPTFERGYRGVKINLSESTRELIDAAEVLVNETHESFVLYPLNEDKTIDENSPAVAVTDEESWRHVGKSGGLHTFINPRASAGGIQVGLDFLKHSISVSANFGRIDADLGGTYAGLDLNLHPLAPLGFKYVYINGKLFGARGYNDVDVSRSKLTMRGIGIGLLIPLGQTFAVQTDAGPTTFRFHENESGEVYRKKGWYFFMSFIGTTPGNSGRLLKRKRAEIKTLKD